MTVAAIRAPANLWFVSYALLGLTQSGLLPVLMPLASHGSAAGLTYAAFSLLGVFAPFLGSWADRTGRQRDLLIWGAASSGLLLLFFGAVPAPVQLVLAAGAGFGVMATTTAGSVLAIQGQPEALWDARVALLQRCISAGQVMGLVAGGALARGHPAVGFVAAGAALLAAAALALLSAPSGRPRAPTDRPAPHPMVGGDAGVSRAGHRGHHLSWPEFRAALRVISRPLRRFLIVWLVAYPAMNGFATLFPAAMVRQFGLSPLWPAGVYALGVAASLFLYRPVGAATHRLGGGRALIGGIGTRLLLLGVLGVIGFAHSGLVGWAALIGFALIQFVWPLLAVGANSLAVRLAPEARGESVGLFNAATSLAAAVGSALAGPIFDWGGFGGLTVTAFLFVGAALVLSLLWLKSWEAHPPADARSVRVGMSSDRL